jgi:cold shock CspA family protein
MAQGTIKNLVNERGFGVMLPADAPLTGKDLFFHRVNVQGRSYAAL